MHAFRNLITMLLLVLCSSVLAFANTKQDILKTLDQIVDTLEKHDVPGFQQRVATKHFVSRFMDNVKKYAFVRYTDDTSAEAGTKFMGEMLLTAGMEGFKIRAERMLLTEVKTGENITPVSLAAARAALATMKDTSTKNDLVTIEPGKDVAIVEMGLILRDAQGLFKVPVRIRFIKRPKGWIVYEMANMQEILTNRRARALLMSEITNNSSQPAPAK
jgi:hypothetical protein